jgi:hypothetical protein
MSNDDGTKRLQTAIETLQWYANDRHYDEDGAPGSWHRCGGYEYPDEVDFDADRGARAADALRELGEPVPAADCEACRRRPCAPGQRHCGDERCMGDLDALRWHGDRVSARDIEIALRVARWTHVDGGGEYAILSEGVMHTARDTWVPSVTYAPVGCVMAVAGPYTRERSDFDARMRPLPDGPLRCVCCYDVIPELGWASVERCEGTVRCVACESCGYARCRRHLAMVEDVELPAEPGPIFGRRLGGK